MSGVHDGMVERRRVDGTFIERVARPSLAAALGLEPHPEGGWYRRTWASGQTVAVMDGTGARRARQIATVIVFLLPEGESSAWHRVASDEVWIWSGLGSIDLQLGGWGERPQDTEEGEIISLGDASEGLATQGVVPAGTWQRTLPADHDALASCLVAPGFDFDDFDLAPEEETS